MFNRRDCWNKINIQPNTKKLQEAFYLFRSKDVANMTKYYIFTSGGYFALAIYQFSEAPSNAAFLQLLPFFMVFAFRILVYVLKDKFTNQLGWFFLAIALFQVGQCVLGTPSGSNQGGDGELDEDKAQSQLRM